MPKDMNAEDHTASKSKTRKPSIRARSEPYPRHALSAPAGSPHCYGDQIKRTFSNVCGKCAYEPMCAAFCDTVNSFHQSDFSLQKPPLNRMRWDDREPLLAVIEKGLESMEIHKTDGLSYRQRGLLWMLQNRPKMANQFSVATERLFGIRALPLETAVEVAVLAVRYGEELERAVNAHRKPDDQRSLPRSRFDSTRVAYSAEIARRILMSQGRETVLSARFVHEGWCVVFDDPKSLRSIKKCWKRDYGGLIRFRSRDWKSEGTDAKPP